MQQLLAADGAELRQGKQCRKNRGWGVDHGSQMGIVELENIGGDCVEERGGKGVRPLAAADDGRLRRPKEWAERTQCQLDRDVPATSQSRPDEIYHRSPGLAPCLCRDILPRRRDNELCELPG